MTGKLQDYYPKFEANQVLTNDHLNDLRQYLDEQLRLSRSMLSGVGIACGLTFDSTATTITIHEGFGTTTEGYLILFPGEEKDAFGKGFSLYTRYRNYKDPSFDYYWSGNTAQDPIQIDVKLLLTQDEYEAEVSDGLLLPADCTYPIPAGKYDCAALIDPALLTDMVVVLYLELEDLSLKSCSGNDCDNKGAKRYLKVRPLLIKKGDVAIMSDGEHEPHEIKAVDIDGHVVRLQEPETLAIPRFIKGLKDNGKVLTDINNYTVIRDAYTTAIAGYPALLESRIQTAFDIYGPFLGLTSHNISYLTGLSATVFPLNAMQFAHDFLKDLTLAYNEFVSACWELRRDCCIEDYEFARHLMLGAIQKEPEYHDVYRNYFLSTAITPEQDRRFRKTQWMFQRMLLMIKGFEPIVSSGAALPADYLPLLLPSREDEYPLGVGAISDFYNKTSNVKDLRKVWNPDLSLRLKSEEVLSFTPADYTSRPETLKPLNYNIDPYPFFRSESVLGKSYNEVRAGFANAIKTHNLPFKTISLHLNGGFDVTTMDLDCHFAHLQDDYIQVRSELAILISNLSNLGIDLATLSTGFRLLPTFLTYYTGIYLDLPITFSPSLIYDFGIKPPVKGGAPVPGYESSTWFTWFVDLYRELQDGLLYIRLMVQHNLDIKLRQPCDDCGADGLAKEISDMQHVIEILDNVIDSGLYARMIALTRTFQHRVSLLASYHPHLFSNFVQNHPGLEHLGGVEKGGTFILVYDSETNADTRRIVADFSLPYLCCSDCSEPVIPPGTSVAVTLHPFPRPDMVIMGPGETIEIEAKERDIDPSFGAILNNPELVISDATIVSNPAGGAGATVSVNAAGDRIIFTSDSGMPPLPEIVRISYTLRNNVTTLETVSSVLVLVRENFPAIVKAVDDFAVTDACTELVIDVLANDCVPESGCLLGFAFAADGSLSSTPIITDLGATVEVYPAGSADLNPRLIYYPSVAGSDSFSYIVVSAEGLSSTATVTVQVVNSCCCCEDIVRTVKAGDTMIFDFFTELLAVGSDTTVMLAAPSSSADQDSYYKTLITLGDDGLRSDILTLASAEPGNTNVGSTDFTAMLDTDSLFKITPNAAYSGNLYIPYRMSLFGGRKKCIGIIVVNVSCDCSGAAPCVTEKEVPDDGGIHVLEPILTSADLIAKAELRFDVGGVPSITIGTLPAGLTGLTLFNDSAGIVNAAFRFRLDPVTTDPIEWPYFVVTVVAGVTTIIRSCTLRLHPIPVSAPCIKTFTIPKDLTANLSGILTAPEISAGNQLRFKSAGPPFVPVIAFPAPLPSGMSDISLISDSTLGGVQTAFLFTPTPGFTGTVSFQFYTVDTSGAVIKECTMTITVSGSVVPIVIRTFPADVSSIVDGLLTLPEAAVGYQIRFRVPTPPFDFSPTYPGTLPDGGLATVSLVPDSTLGAPNAAFSFSPMPGFLGTIEFGFYKMQKFGALLTIHSEYLLQLIITPTGSFKFGGATIKSPFFDLGDAAIGASSKLMEELDGMSADKDGIELITSGKGDSFLAEAIKTPVELVRDEMMKSRFNTRRIAFFEELFSELVTATFKLANMQEETSKRSPLLDTLKAEFTIISEMIAAGAIDKIKSPIVTNARLLKAQPSNLVLTKAMLTLLKTI